MITPIEIQSKTFKGGIGYLKKDVEEFINVLNIDYESMFKENKELKDQIRILTNTLTHYKSIENELNNALDLAKHAAQEIKDNARKKATEIEEDAHNKAKLILSDANTEFVLIQKKMTELSKLHQDYLNRCKEITQKQIETLDAKETMLDMSDSMLEVAITDNKNVTDNDSNV